LDEGGLNLVPLSGSDGNVSHGGNGTSNAEVMDDAIDSLVETVLDKGGQVVFTDSGALENTIASP
jgi:hypothetical protein